MKKHEKWLNSEKQKGDRLVLREGEKELWGVNLSGCNFREADLTGADLRGANLQGANLSEANLRGTRLYWAILTDANLQGAHLEQAQFVKSDIEVACNWILAFYSEDQFCELGLPPDYIERVSKKNLSRYDLEGLDLHEANLQDANLRGANLKDAKLQDADLQNADLTGVTGLLGKQLAGANLSGAKLPEDIAKFEGLGNIEEVSRSAGKLLVSMLLGCVYSGLTILTTTDVGLLTNSATSPLPIIGTEIPIVWFYVLAPIILFGFYIYFHLCLQRLWEGLTDLPAVFPDGIPLDKKAHPWFLSGLLRTHFRRLTEGSTFLSDLQKDLFIVLAWWVVPITLLLLWGRFLHRQEWRWWGTPLHIALLMMSTVTGITLYRLAVMMLRGDHNKPLKLLHIILALVIGIGCCFLSVGATHGIPQPSPLSRPKLPARAVGATHGIPQPSVNTKDSEQSAREQRITLWALVPTAFKYFGCNPFANLEEMDVSTKPANWTGIEIGLVKGARLRGNSLRNVRAFRAFLVNADLRESDLRWADLTEADLRSADMSMVVCANEDDPKTEAKVNLQEAKLEGAKLQKANLQYANLQRTDLRESDLTEANLEGTELQSAELQKAKLQNAILKTAQLQDAKLQEANLQGADLRSAQLQRAILTKAQLHGANLSDAHLQGADLRGVTGLTLLQILSAYTDGKTRLPDHLQAQFR